MTIACKIGVHDLPQKHTMPCMPFGPCTKVALCLSKSMSVHCFGVSVHGDQTWKWEVFWSKFCCRHNGGPCWRHQLHWQLHFGILTMCSLIHGLVFLWMEIWNAKMARHGQTSKSGVNCSATILHHGCAFSIDGHDNCLSKSLKMSTLFLFDCTNGCI